MNTPIGLWLVTVVAFLLLTDLIEDWRKKRGLDE